MSGVEMSDPNRSGRVPGELRDPQSRLRSILSEGSHSDVLERLASARLLTLPKGLPVQKLDIPLDPNLVKFTEGIARIDPCTPHVALGDGKIMGVFADVVSINTEADPPYHRAGNNNTRYRPYHVVWMFNFEPSTTYTVVVRLQVWSPNLVRITGTSNPTLLTVGQSPMPLNVPVEVTTTGEGFASVLIHGHDDATGFDWLSAKVL